MASTDRSLALSVLRISTCHAFGGGRLPSTLDEAIGRLSQKHLYELGIGLGGHTFIRSLKPRAKFDPSRLCQSGMFVGLLATSLVSHGESTASPLHDPDQILSYALIKDLHIAAMTHVVPDIYDKIADYAAVQKWGFRRAFSTLLAEPSHKIFKTMARAWRLPPSFSNFAEKLESELDLENFNREIACLILAEEVAIARNLGSDTWTVEVEETPDLRDLIGISPEELEKLIQITQSDVIHYLQSFALAS